ncbi:hypothetical protein [Aliikangiella maris]|uniref:Uncharacterized protein n=2 Tax=Aliikangiella maris TaxID=3162458 RepID=A0ABV3MTV1_9GAMM
MGFKRSDYPKNIFNTWLEYRDQQHGETESYLIEIINEKLDKKFNKTTFYRWKKQEIALSDNVVEQFIYPDLIDMLKWFFNENGINIKDNDIKKLADKFKPQIKLNYFN